VANRSLPALKWDIVLYRLTELAREILPLSVNTCHNRPDFILASSSWTSTIGSSKKLKSS
jgi:hypothetical protein